MNDKSRDKSGDGMDDEVMEEVFGSLSGIEVPRDVSEANREVLRRALCERNRNWRGSWWRVRVSVPWPIAAAVLIGVGVMMFVAGQGQAVMEVEKPEKAGGVRSEDVRGAVVMDDEVYYMERSVYVCGKGFVSFDRGYEFYKESDYVDQ